MNKKERNIGIFLSTSVFLIVVLFPLTKSFLESTTPSERTISWLDCKDSLFYHPTSDDLVIKQEQEEESCTPWYEAVDVYHFWRKLADKDYLFDVPDPKLVIEWIALCEKRSPIDSMMREGFPAYYQNMNQYVTFWDFVELWYNEDSRIADNDLALWRLAQYNHSINLPSSEYEKFSLLKDAIHNLCNFEAEYQYEMNVRSELEADFQELYDRVLVREAIRHSDTSIAKALEKEEKAWQEYHAELDSTFIILDGYPEGLDGARLKPMATSGIALDDAHIRETSISDFYFALVDSLAYSERHSHISENNIIREYNRFMDSLEETVYNYPIPQRRKALGREMDAWGKWMKSRSVVSSLLTGLCKEAYDNSTNTVRRMKLIMLKNRYSGYGVISGDVWRLQIPYTASDEELDGPSFDERWNAMLDSLKNSRH